jgi:hypothetical protein
LAYGAALAGETQIRHFAAIDLEFDADLIAAERVHVLGGSVGLLQVPEVARIAIVIENEVAVEIVHALEFKHARGLFQRRYECIDVLFGVVDVE